jgi:hypothetical protein
MARAAGATGGGDAVTATVAVALALVSASLRATTWHVPGAAGAVYKPSALTVPHPASETDHVTVVVEEPVTAAAKGMVAPTTTLAVVGASATETWPGLTGSDPEAPQPAKSPAERRAAAANRRSVTSACLSRDDNQAR